MSNMDKLAKELQSLMSASEARKPKPYDTQANVIRVDGNTAWVHIPGGVDETPVKLTLNAKKGDAVNVRVAGGSAWITGNSTNPPTDDTQAFVAKEKADKAYSLGEEALQDAERARVAANNAESEALRAQVAANSAQTSADQAAQAASDADAKAVAAGTAAQTAITNAAAASQAASEADAKAVAAGTAAATAEANAQTAIANAATAQSAADTAEANAQTAITNAAAAQTSANNAATAANSAQQSADSALVNLATAQDVVGVLTWITNHGSMASQSGGTFVDGQVYFVADQNGDYVVDGTHYSVVAEPKAEDIDDYYILSVSESVQNYVATHLAVDAEGLWIIPETNGSIASNGKKILIATGGGSIYTNAGTYIIDRANGSAAVLAKFLASNAQIGKDGESRLGMDYHSLQLIDKEGNPYFYVSDLRESDGYARITQHFTGDGEEQYFVLYFGRELEDPDILSVSIDGEPISSTEYEMSGSSLYFETAPPSESNITIRFRTNNEMARAYTFGERVPQSDVGPSSFATGVHAISSGYCSFAEGEQTTASGYAAHAEGEVTFSTGQATHAEGLNTKAEGTASHAEGMNTEAYSSEIFLPSHAEGYATFAKGSGAHAEGYETKANADRSHAQNYGTIAGYDSQTAIGKFNDNQSTNAFEIGNGTDDESRSNAFVVAWNGNAIASGDIIDGFGNVMSEIASGGISSYNQLSNKPRIEGVELVGDKTYEDLNLNPITNSEIEALTL